MRRLAAAIACDFRLQLRNGFYYAAAFVAVFWVLVLRELPAETVRWLMPLFILSNLQINTFYFVAGLVFLEKGEGTLFAQAVTPLRNWEYLASKTVTLTLLSLIENLLIAVIAFGPGFVPLSLLTGMVTAAAIFIFTGFILASRYDAISDYLFPSLLYTLAFAPPFLNYVGLWPDAFLYLHPLQAPFALTRAAFVSQGGMPNSVYGILYTGLWIAVFFWLSRRAFTVFVTATEGTR